jgi:Flp pilus assembly protein TadD
MAANFSKKAALPTIVILPICIVPIFMLAACSNSSKSPSQEQAATTRWNDARANVLIGLAQDQYQNASFDKSRATIDEAISMTPHGAPAHILSAKLYIETGSLESAERELESARQDDPASAEAEYLSGIVYQRWQQPERALEFYQYACDKSPAELAYVLAKAEMMVQMGRRDEALGMLQSKVAYFEHSGEIRDEVGLLLLQENRYPEAVEMLRRAEILSPDDLSVKEHLAMALFYSKDFTEAGDMLSELMATGKYDHRSDLLSALGECQLESGRASDAVVSLQKAAELAPTDFGVLLSLGRAQLQEGNLRQAEFAVRKCLDLDDSSSQAHLLLGYAQIRQSELQDAYNSFATASRLDPKDTVSICMEGLALFKMGKKAEAEACYQKALKISPNDNMAKLLASVDEQ